MVLNCLKKWRPGILLFILLAVVACAGAENFEYRSDRETPEGPGLLTGDTGYAEIYRKE